MRTIIHDLENDLIEKMSFNENDIVISSLECKKNCIGCFNCWIKHPTKCVIKDEFNNLTDRIKNSDELVLISKNRYGCYSQNLKRVLERCIGYVLPYFEIRNGSIHHCSRYENKLNLKVYMYGDFDEFDKLCLFDLVKANSINLNAKKYNVKFFEKIEEINKCIQ